MTLQFLISLHTREKLSIFMYRNRQYIIEHGISKKAIAYRYYEYGIYRLAQIHASILHGSKLAPEIEK